MCVFQLSADRRGSDIPQNNRNLPLCRELSQCHVIAISSSVQQVPMSLSGSSSSKAAFSLFIWEPVFLSLCTRFIGCVNMISIHFQANSARAQIKKLVSRVLSVSRCSLGSGVFLFF